MPSATMPDVPLLCNSRHPFLDYQAPSQPGTALAGVQRHGFTHPAHGHFLMLPPEFDLVLAHEPTHVAQVILEVMRQTVGWVGEGPDNRVSGQSFPVDTSPRKAFWTGITPIKASLPL